MAGINTLENSDWLKTRTFDLPHIQTGEQLLDHLQRPPQSVTPEDFLSLPAAQADHPAIHELRQIVWEKHGGQGPAPGSPEPEEPEPEDAFPSAPTARQPAR